MTDNIKMAIDFATMAHAGQFRRNGEAYINHPLRVARNLQTTTNSVILTAALLHDVVEDTDVNYKDLATAGFSNETITIVSLLTKKTDVSEDKYLQNISKNPSASIIKLSDRLDNTSDLFSNSFTEKKRCIYIEETLKILNLQSCRDVYPDLTDALIKGIRNNCHM